MEKNIYSYIWRYSKRQQIIVTLITAASFPFLYSALELPKVIVNDALSSTDFPREYFGIEFDQTSYLLSLCAILLALLLINALFLMTVNTYKNLTSERHDPAAAVHAVSAHSPLSAAAFPARLPGRALDHDCGRGGADSRFYRRRHRAAHLSGRHADGHPNLHVHAGSAARRRLDRVDSASGLRDPQASTQNQPAEQGSHRARAQAVRARR